jgi:hypothetical protein
MSSFMCAILLSTEAFLFEPAAGPLLDFVAAETRDPLSAFAPILSVFPASSGAVLFAEGVDVTLAFSSATSLRPSVERLAIFFEDAATSPAFLAGVSAEPFFPTFCCCFAAFAVSGAPESLALATSGAVAFTAAFSL